MGKTLKKMKVKYQKSQLTLESFDVKILEISQQLYVGIKNVYKVYK